MAKYEFVNTELKRKYRNYSRWFVALVLVGGVFALIAPRWMATDSMTTSGWNYIGYAIWCVAFVVAILQKRIKDKDKEIRNRQTYK